MGLPDSMDNSTRDIDVHTLTKTLRSLLQPGIGGKLNFNVEAMKKAAVPSSPSAAAPNKDSIDSYGDFTGYVSSMSNEKRKKLINLVEGSIMKLKSIDEVLQKSK